MTRKKRIKPKRMESWNVYIQASLKKEVKEELKRLGLGNSEHFENMLRFFDLKRFETKVDYYKAL